MQLLHHLFERSAQRWPENIAVDVPEGTARASRQAVTYSQLSRDAAKIAAVLGTPHEGERVVAILLPRDTHLLYAAQIAVLRAGAAYVCLDPSHPAAHMEHILRDSRSVLLLTTDSLSHSANGAIPAHRVVDVVALLRESPDAEPAGAGEPNSSGSTNGGQNSGSNSAASTLAYITYTSGTSGAPKGVMIEHAGVVSLINSGVERFGMSPGDRVAQGSSAAYDSSVEETWLALASGATVVVLDDESVRLGPDLTAWLRDERVTIFCPPPTLMRAMNCVSPDEALPDLRLCYAGGEHMPQDLADRWSRRIWLENGYGPTECSVTVVRGRLREGEAVSIGEPVPGNVAFVLNEDLAEVADGEAGELCIGGIGLARGYLNQPELTAQRFVSHPRLGRLYKTGDLVLRNGGLHYLGRMDSQVKVRGHRVELEAVESALCSCDGVREAACALQDYKAGKQLVAFVVATTPDRPPRWEELSSSLHAILPSHAVPARFGLLRSLPRTLGGKLNRAALPALADPQTNGAAAMDHAALQLSDEVERVIADAFAAQLASSSMDSKADFFALGGDSLRAAQLISELRRNVRTASLAVRDVYEARTVNGLAERVREREQRKKERAHFSSNGTAASCATAERVSAAPNAASRTPVDSPPGTTFMTAVQCVWIAAVLVLSGALAYATTFLLLPWMLSALGPLLLLLLSPLLSAALLAVYSAGAVCFTVAVKRILVGAYKPERAPVWGGFHLRNWIVQRAVRLIPWKAFEGTELQCVALRALGARIGKRVHIHRDVDVLQGGWDLLTIGDDVTVAQEATLALVQLDAGHVVVGPVTIGCGSTLDVRAGVAPESELEANTFLTALSWLPAGSRVPAGERWGGVPARPLGKAPIAEQPLDGDAISPTKYAVLLLFSRFLLGPAAYIPALLLALALLVQAGVTEASFMQWLNEPFAELGGALAVVVASLAWVPASSLLGALALRLYGRVPTGSFNRWSPLYVRVWLRTSVLHAAGKWLAGTLYWPIWLRLAGMKVGRKCEISTIIDVLPEHVTVGSESFLADGIYLGVPQVHRGVVTMHKTQLGCSTFVGNHAVIHSGQVLPDRVLLGVCTVADDVQMTTGTSWFGHPPFLLPRREIVEMDRSLTHDPGPVRYANRVFWETLRFVVPLLPAALFLAWLTVVGSALSQGVSTTALLLVVLPAATLMVGAALCGVALAAKWILLGRVHPGQHGLWSGWANRWDFLYVVCERYARPVLSLFEGTLMMNMYHRAMGATIGKRVVLGGGFAQILDPDMLHLEDDATVDCMFQAHSFEDRVLKMDHVFVRSGATAAHASVLLYGADIGSGAHVSPNSVVMKNERLLPHLDYEGSPTVSAPGSTETSEARNDSH